MAKLIIFLSLLLASNLAAAARKHSSSSSSSKQSYGKGSVGKDYCRIDRISTNRPSRLVESEGGFIEMWDQNEDELRCAGVTAMRNTIRPQSLSLPYYTPTPTIAYILKGEGLLGLSVPGCPSTYISEQESSSSQSSYQKGERWGSQSSSSYDSHQKVHRVRRGDVVAIPPGFTHWCYNDNKNEDFVAFFVTDLENHLNQLDEIPRSFYLAGGESSEKGHSTEEEIGGIPSQNILRSMDPQLLSQAFNIPMDLVEKMQRQDERGLIVRVKEDMRMVKPSEERSSSSRGGADNGIEESFCNMMIHYYLNNPNEADLYSRDAGKLNSVNKFKLPILQFLDMSAEMGNLAANAIYSPHWTINAHTIVFVTRGEGHVQVVSNEGTAVFDGQVKEGDVMVVPQYFASIQKAGDSGLEWVAFKTSSLPMRSTLAGSQSVMKGLPVQVISNSYGISSSQAQELKCARGEQMALFPPTTKSMRV